MDISSTPCSYQPAALQSGLTQPSSPESSTSAASRSDSNSENAHQLHYSSQVHSPSFYRHWRSRYSPLQSIRRWLDGLEVRNAKTAHRIARWIPAQCPFERDVTLLGRTIAHIPPLCKLNPLYDQFVTLRFRALCYLADECGEDIRFYC